MTTEPPAEPPRRRRFGLSVRALMVLVLIVGGGIGCVVNHASYHRGQVASKLKRFGVEPPVTDLVAWAIERTPRPTG